MRTKPKKFRVLSAHMSWDSAIPEPNTIERAHKRLRAYNNSIKRAFVKQHYNLQKYERVVLDHKHLQLLVVDEDGGHVSIPITVKDIDYVRLIDLPTD